jgi:hypothetical protein
MVLSPKTATPFPPSLAEHPVNELEVTVTLSALIAPPKPPEPLLLAEHPVNELPVTVTLSQVKIAPP